MRSRFSQPSLTNSPITRPRPRRRSISRNKVLTVPDRAFCSLAGNNTLAPITHSKLVADAARGCCADSQAALSTNPGCKTRSRASAETNSDTSHPRDSSNAGNASSNAAHACSNTASNTADASRNTTNTSSDAADSGSNTTRNSANASCCSKRNAASRDAADPQYLSDGRHSNHRTFPPPERVGQSNVPRFGELNGCRLRAPGGGSHRLALKANVARMARSEIPNELHRQTPLSRSCGAASSALRHLAQCSAL